MYDPRVGRWTSQDPSGFAPGDSNLYRYVKNDPINTVDSTGLAGCDSLQIEVKVKPAAGAATGWDGAFAWPVDYELSAPADPKKGGWIIQHVVMTYSDRDTKTFKEKIHPFFRGKRDEMDYWEAWRIDPKAKASDAKGPLAPADVALLTADGVTVPKVNGDDWFAVTGAGNDTVGCLTIQGTVYYFDGMGNGELEGFRRGGALFAINLLSVNSKKHPEVIKKLFDNHKYTSMAEHALYANWDTRERKNTRVETVP
jgi:hypothetical protein